MKDIHELLIKNNIPYWIAAGSLLGAARHKGFIPWDKDLDIWIPKSYEKDVCNLFLQLEELGYDYKHGPGFAIQIFKKGEDLHFNPYMDIFFVIKKTGKFSYQINGFGTRNGEALYFTDSEIFPLKEYQFGDIIVFGPNDPIPFLNAAYGKNWPTAYKHILLTEEDKKPAQPTGPLEDRV